MNLYKIIVDNGDITFVKARSRTGAIKRYCADIGINTVWAKYHIKVVNMGRVDHECSKAN